MNPWKFPARSQVKGNLGEMPLSQKTQMWYDSMNQSRDHNDCSLNLCPQVRHRIVGTCPSKAQAGSCLFFPCLPWSKSELSWQNWSLVCFTWQQLSRLTCPEPHKHAASWHQNSEKEHIQGVSRLLMQHPDILGWQFSVLRDRVGGSISFLYTPIINCSTPSPKSQQWQLSQEISQSEVCGCLLSWVEIISSLHLDCSYSTPSCCPRLWGLGHITCLPMPVSSVLPKMTWYNDIIPINTVTTYWSLGR